MRSSSRDDRECPARSELLSKGCLSAWEMLGYSNLCFDLGHLQIGVLAFPLHGQLWTRYLTFLSSVSISVKWGNKGTYFVGLSTE